MTLPALLGALVVIAACAVALAWALRRIASLEGKLRALFRYFEHVSQLAEVPSPAEVLRQESRAL